MNDTTPRANALVVELLRRKTPWQRLDMVCDMYAAARSFMETALEEQGLIAGTAEWKLAVLDRMYGAEISPRKRRALLARWRADDLAK